MASSSRSLDMRTIDRQHLAALTEHEANRFAAEHPNSKALFERARASLLGGVPMNWMVKWAGPFPVFVEEAHGSHFIDVDGFEYVDFCLGDTGAMTGHSPDAAADAIAAQARRGITFMLPTEDSIWVGEELVRRFGLPYWQFTLTATDANRFSIRIARHITERPFVLVFNYCYHGTVDESFATLENGAVVPRRGNIGPPVNPAETTRVVEFNDLDALEKALARRDVACVLAEPAMTNVGIIHPDPGYHAALRELTRRTGTLLILDETHTICAGPGGYTRAHNLEPDMFVIGKPLASGIPAAAYGFTAEIAERIVDKIHIEDCDTGGIGGTLAGNAMSLAAMRATLETVLVPDAFARMIPMAERFERGVASSILGAKMPWHVTRLGCRAEYQFRPTPPRNGSEAAAAMDFPLERFLHLHALNRGILLTPFHNMALTSPATSEADVDLHTHAFGEALRDLAGESVSS
ncbi:MAG: aspartate aminotransferase family protein [Candidatus Acidiferrales bacterium]